MKKLSIVILCLVLLLSACSFPGLGGSAKSDGIVVASGNTSERQILSELVIQMVNYYFPDVDTGLINNLGSTFLIVQTVNRGDSNVIGANYTGTSLTGELGLEATTDPEEAQRLVVEGYSDQMDMVWFPSYGFANTYAFMVRKDFAEEHNLSKVSDLKKLKDDLRVGVDTGWMDRPGDGYESFKDLYGYAFGNILPMEIGLVYDALKDKKMDVVLGYSTDGRIQSNDLVLLEDDKQLFPPYDAAPVIKKDLLEKYPKLEEVILKLEGVIDSETMQKLNRKSDELKVEPNIIAKEFLEENNFFEDKEAKPLKEREEYKEIMGGK